MTIATDRDEWGQPVFDPTLGKPKPQAQPKPKKATVNPTIKKVVQKAALNQVASREIRATGTAGIVAEWVEIGVLWGGLGIIVTSSAVLSAAGAMQDGWQRISQSQVARWLNLAPEQVEGSSQSTAGADGGAIADAALKWVGKSFNPGVMAQCAVFVRDVLAQAGVKLDPSVTAQPLDGIATSEAFANSFGPDQGQHIKEKGDLQPGDLVMFFNTYGNYAPGTITHVGIYVGDGQMVDRPTADAPVKKRGIDTFQFAGAIRIASGTAFSADAYKRWIATQESGNNYSSVNPHSGALGKYQFMPDTMRSTALKCDGVAYQPTEAEFLGTPDLQEKVMDCYLNRALVTIQKKTPDPSKQCRMMASYHYSGSPDLWDNTNPQSYNGAAYPSIAEYTASVCKEIL